jgi:hypothetical protein
MQASPIVTIVEGNLDIAEPRAPGIPVHVAPKLPIHPMGWIEPLQ